MAEKITRRQQKGTSVQETRREPINGAVVALGQAVVDDLNGNIAGALSRLESSDVDQNSVDLVAARGHLLLQANRFEEAQKAFSRLISIDPTLETAHFH